MEMQYMKEFKATGRLKGGGLAQNTIKAKNYEQALLTASSYIKEVPEIIYIIVSNPEAED